MNFFAKNNLILKILSTRYAIDQWRTSPYKWKIAFLRNPLLIVGLST